MKIRPSSGLLWLLVLALCTLAPAHWAAMAHAADTIADQPGVRRFALSNGLEVVIVTTDDAPPGDGGDSNDMSDIQLWLAVRAGTMDEDDTQRGAAGVLERLLYQGIGEYDPESIRTLLGGDGGYDPNAGPSGSMVALDQTLLMGRAPGGEPAQIESLLGLYAKVLDPAAWSFELQDIAQAKAELTQMVQGMLNPEMRARQQWLPILLGDGRLGTRVGLPEPTAIEALDPAQIARFAQAYLRPSRATLIVVGGREAAQLDAVIAQTLGTLDAGERGKVVDLRLGIDQDQSQPRPIMSLDPELQGHLAALVWLRERDDACLAPWSVCAARYNEDQMRAMVIDRVAGELIRHRIDRLGLASLGRDTLLRVDQIGLGGQVDLLQCVVQRQNSDDWQSTIRLLLSECDRLARDGAGSEEIVRARGSLLARWHRGADDWRTQSNAERVWLVHWLVTSGRAVQDMVHWDEQATRMMSSISAAEINDALRRLLSPDKVRVLVVANGQASDSVPASAKVDALIREVRRAPLAAIDPDWMRTLGGSLLDESEMSGEITRVSQHAPSGTWTATLASGAVVSARSTQADDDQMELCATLWGAMFRDESLSEAQIDAAMQAWVTPSSETRSAHWLAVYMQEHGLELETQRVVGGVQLRIRSGANQSRAALELLYLLLDRPMIDAQAFADWSSRNASANHLGPDPFERGLVMLYQPTLAARPAHEITLDDAQRTLTRIVRNARIGVGIAGAIDPAAEIEQAAKLLGELTPREAKSPRSAAHSQHTIIAREKSVVLSEMQRDSDELIFGMRGSSMADLDRLRATILATMVLNDRARALGRAEGIENTRIDAQVVMCDAIGDHWAMVLRARGHELTQAEFILREALDTLVSDGIPDDELAAVKHELDDSIGRYFDRTGYWSRRLSELGMHGREVHDLWSIREGYAAIDSVQASEAIRAAVNEPDRFRVLIQGRDER